MTEDLVRDTFREQEQQVEGWQTPLGPVVRRKVVRRRVAKWWVAGALSFAVMVGGGLAGLNLRRDNQQAPPPGTTTTVSQWRLESSLGVQAEVPADWATNDFGCNMSDKPSVVRGVGASRMCLTPEPASKEVAIFGSGELPETPAAGAADVTVDGVPARRSSTTLDKGRYHGWISVPSLDVYLVVRTLSRATTDHILDSFSLTDADHLGCPAVRPPVTAGQAPPGDGFLPPKADSVAVCRYAHTAQGRLEASATVADSEVGPLIAALNSAPQGRNPDPAPGQCIDTEQPATDVVLLVTAGATVTRVWIVFGYCTGRGMTNGLREASVSDEVIHAVMRPLKIGYAIPNGPGK